MQWQVTCAAACDEELVYPSEAPLEQVVACQWSVWPFPGRHLIDAVAWDVLSVEWNAHLDGLWLHLYRQKGCRWSFSWALSSFLSSDLVYSAAAQLRKGNEVGLEVAFVIMKFASF